MDASGTSQRLLLRREHAALRATVRARGGLALFGMAAVWTTSTPREGLLTSTLLALALVVVVVLDRGLNDPQRLRAVGLGGAILDSIVLCGMPIIWHVVHTAPDRPLVHLIQHQLGLITFLLIIVNCASLRPLYPALVTGVGASLHLLLAVIGTLDPRLDAIEGGIKAVIGVGESHSDLFLKPVLVLVGGFALTAITRSARDTMEEAVQLERQRQLLREQQLRLVLEGQMKALAQLVAGVEHEVKNPLGALKSAADTATRGLQRLAEILGEDDAPERTRKVERVTRAIEDAVQLTADAAERLGGVMGTIDRFVQLDRAAHGPVDLAACLGDAVEIVRPTLPAAVTVECDAPKGLVVMGDGGRLSQAFATIIRNAGEAIEGRGRVRVTAEGAPAHAIVRVVDDGRGMGEDQIARLFDVAFGEGTRVHARFGLAACRAVVHDHGGEIEVDSEPGRGTEVRITLPLGPDSAADA